MNYPASAWRRASAWCAASWCARAASWGRSAAALQTLFGGNITLYTRLCERTRDDAYQLMLRHARELGANAVIGVRYDATEIGAGITEVLAYGTAVRVEALG